MSESTDLVSANPNPKRANESEDPDSVVKKSKTGNDSNPEAGSDEFGSREVEPVAREMGFEIEADATEDKGSRHSMEDAWVVLLDAAMDYPGKLRFLILSFVFSCNSYHVCTISFLMFCYGGIFL